MRLMAPSKSEPVERPLVNGVNVHENIETPNEQH